TAVAEGRPVRAIVRFRDGAARARAAQLVQYRGGRVRRALSRAALTIDVDAATAHELAGDAGTLGLSLDATVRSAGIAPGPLAAARTQASGPIRRAAVRGRGVAVAVIDSGVRPHADLPSSRIRAFVDFVNGRRTPYDDFGHGTH